MSLDHRKAAGSRAKAVRYRSQREGGRFAPSGLVAGSSESGRFADGRRQVRSQREGGRFAPSGLVAVMIRKATRPLGAIKPQWIKSENMASG
ncbi:MAG: hypothetical protein COU72_05055 [Parcubacteria group bacterium CG10_big_fil_rev_8_21_14_0_10_41_35]|nr:MAG: hypothetical protein COU72_05055 [Parcubacteria group bacterium CG10_big_fil_rev_8_21_14_0_10_41_35]